MSDFLYEILIPTIVDGKPVRRRQHKVWDKAVQKITGGLTVCPPTIIGYWASQEGELFSERTIPVRIKCTKEQINTIADFTASFYKQKAIMFYLISNEVCIINYVDGKRV
jgi:hypothetical protein